MLIHMLVETIRWVSLLAHYQAQENFLDEQTMECIQKTRPIIEDALSVCGLFPFKGPPSEEKLFEFFDVFIPSLREMDIGELKLVPGGWKCSKGIASHALMFIVMRVTEMKYRFIVVNTGENGGLDQYHPARATDHTIERRMCFVIDDVKQDIVLDAAFWFLLLRPLVWPSQGNPSPKKLIYEILLPFLNGKTFEYNYSAQASDPISRWSRTPNLGDSSTFYLGLYSYHYILRAMGLSEGRTAHVLVLLQTMILRVMQYDLAQARSLSQSEANLIELACQHITHFAGQPGEDQASAKMPIELFDLIKRSIQTTRDLCGDLRERSPAVAVAFKSLQPELPTPLRSEWHPLPLFDRFTDNEDVEALAGSSRLPPLLRPVELTLVPSKVTNFEELCCALRHCDHLCQLISCQTTHIHHSYFLRVALIEHLFTSAIPLPLAPDHSNRFQCLYRQPLSYDRQVDILRSLMLITRHFSAATLSVRVTRTLDAIRTLTMACVAAVTDAIVRIQASDIPSHFSLHISGAAPGPVLPYGIDIGTFEIQSEFMTFTRPEYHIARTQVLDYFTAQCKLVPADNILFDFTSESHHCSAMDNLLQQLCWDMGFDRNVPSVNYLTGADPRILEFYPELGFFRDIMFTFKFLMSSSSSTLPDIRHWTQYDAKLKWKFSPERGYIVSGFGKELKIENTNVDKKQNWLTFLFSLVSKQTRAPLSAADPSAVAGAPVYDEEDVLHLLQLPTFGKQLSYRQSELLISYLTAPYLRIPLLLSFFASPDKITVLSSRRLQAVLDCSMFEPSHFLFDGDEDSPLTCDKVPFEDRRKNLATPCGLLFNELKCSPDGIMKSIQDMLDTVLEMRTSSFSPSSSPIVLYVIRLVVRVEEFVIYLMNHYKWQQGGKNSITEGKWGTHIRGLRVSDETYRTLCAAHIELRETLNTEVHMVLERWCERAMDEKDIRTACMLHAHLIFLFKNVTPDEYNVTNVSTLLSSQIYLKTRHFFTLDAARSGRRQSVDGKLEDPDDLSLGFTDSDLFCIFQKHRYGMYAWLQSHAEETNEILESVVRVVTMTGPRGRPADAPPNRQWRCAGYRGREGIFVPDDGKPPVNPAQVRPGPGESYPSWLHRVQLEQNKGDVEINIQFGDFTLRNSRLV